MINAILEDLRKCIQNIVKDIKLEKAPEQMEETLIEYEKVSPAVYVGWIPQNGMENYAGNAPSITVMADDGEDLDENNISSMKIRLSIAVYDPGTTGENENVSLNYNGYKDLNNLIDTLKKGLIKENMICSIDRNIKWSIPREQAYPYWIGNIEFNVQYEETKISNIEIESML